MPERQSRARSLRYRFRFIQVGTKLLVADADRAPSGTDPVSTELTDADQLVDGLWTDPETTRHLLDAQKRFLSGIPGEIVRGFGHLLYSSLFTLMSRAAAHRRTPRTRSFLQLGTRRRATNTSARKSHRKVIN